MDGDFLFLGWRKKIISQHQEKKRILDLWNGQLLVEKILKMI